ncbi:MAG: gamma-glutamyltransferase, partial [Thermoplasmata archaeon]
QGNMVSYIQSNYMGFGSGLVVPGTGIALQNRGTSFSLDPSHSNSLEPGKRPFHTIIPGFITLNGSPMGPFGVMGGHMQPQGHVQVVSNMIDFGMNPQAALDSPRWMWEKERKVLTEPSMPEHVVQGLYRRGHGINYTPLKGYFGRGQIILKADEAYCAGTEPRADGHIAVR